MVEYTNIAELDQAAFDIRNSWKVTINHATSFAQRFRAINERFKSGEFSPEWTFARWLVAKCGMSLRTSYRVIEQLERTADEDEKRRTKEALSEIRKQQAQEETDRRARQLAWDDWLLEEKNRKQASQAAWDEWRAEQKIVQTAWDEWRAADKKKEAKRKRQREWARRKKANKDRDNNQIQESTHSATENQKPLPAVAKVSLEMVLAELVALISAIPKADRLPAIRRVVGVLHELCDDIDASGEATGWVAAGIDIRH